MLEIAGDNLVVAKEILGLSNFKDFEGDNPENRDDSLWLLVGARDVPVDVLLMTAGAKDLHSPLVESLDEGFLTKRGPATDWCSALDRDAGEDCADVCSLDPTT